MTQTLSTMLLALLVEMIHLRPFAPDAISTLVGLPLRPIVEVSNPYFVVYRSSSGPANRFFSAIEVRVPTENSHGKGGLVIAELQSLDIKFEEMTKHFGKPATRRRGSQHSPDSLTYHVYPQAWGTITFGTSRDLLYIKRIVLEAATGQPPDK